MCCNARLLTFVTPANECSRTVSLFRNQKQEKSVKTPFSCLSPRGTSGSASGQYRREFITIDNDPTFAFGAMSPPQLQVVERAHRRAQPEDVLRGFLGPQAVHNRQF